MAPALTHANMQTDKLTNDSEKILTDQGNNPELRGPPRLTPREPIQSLLHTQYVRGITRRRRQWLETLFARPRRRMAATMTRVWAPGLSLLGPVAEGDPVGPSACRRLAAREHARC